MDCWENAVAPIRRVWIRLAIRLGIRKSGLLKLRHDVRSCPYEDVHVMWEMLQRTEPEISGRTSEKKSKRRPFWKMVVWASRPSNFCRGY